MKKCPPPVAPGDGQRIPHERQLAMKNTILPRPRLVAAVGAVIALAVSGCAVDTSTPTTADRVVASTTTAPVEPVVDENPTGTVISTVAADEGISIAPGMASEYAAIICEGFDDDLSLVTMVRIGASALPRFTEQQHAYLIGASVGALCPEFSYRIEGF